MANGYSFESTERELSNEYQHDRVSMVFKRICVLVLWMKVASALEGVKPYGAKWSMLLSRVTNKFTFISPVDYGIYLEMERSNGAIYLPLLVLCTPP